MILLLLGSSSSFVLLVIVKKYLPSAKIGLLVVYEFDDQFWPSSTVRPHLNFVVRKKNTPYFLFIFVWGLSFCLRVSASLFSCVNLSVSVL